MSNVHSEGAFVLDSHDDAGALARWREWAGWASEGAERWDEGGVHRTEITLRCRHTRLDDARRTHVTISEWTLRRDGEVIVPSYRQYEEVDGVIANDAIA